MCGYIDYSYNIPDGTYETGLVQNISLPEDNTYIEAICQRYLLAISKLKISDALR